MANSFIENGFNVFLDDVICDETRLRIYSENLKDMNLITLLPSKEIVAKRDLERGEYWAMGERAIYLHGKICEFLEKNKDIIRIDSSNQTAEETAEEIIQRFF